MAAHSTCHLWSRLSANDWGKEGSRPVHGENPFHSKWAFRRHADTDTVSGTAAETSQHYAVSPCQLPVPRLSLYVCHLYIKRLKIQLETSNCSLTRFKTNQSITGTCPIFVSVNNLNISGLQMNCYLLIHHQSQSLTSFKYNCTPQMLLSKTQYSLLWFQWPNCLQWPKPVAI